VRCSPRPAPWPTLYRKRRHRRCNTRAVVPWRDLPGDFGAGDALYNRFRRWISSGSKARQFELLTENPPLGRCSPHPHRPYHRTCPFARRRCPAEKRAAAQGLGKSRGGFTSKILVTAADADTAAVVDVLLSGQAGDAPLLEPMLEQTIDRVPHFDELVGDKGFDGDDQRPWCMEREVFPNIPNRKNRELALGFIRLRALANVNAT